MAIPGGHAPYGSQMDTYRGLEHGVVSQGQLAHFK
jgi:hypothetical protein